MSALTSHADAQARFRNGDLAGARRMFEAALSHDPGHPASHHDLGFLLRQLGESVRAERHVKSSLALAPELAVGWTTVGLLRGDAGRFANARSAIDRARLIAPGDPTSLIARADLARDDEASTYANLVIDALRHPGLPDRARPRLLHALARLFDRLGDTDQAFDAASAARIQRSRERPYDPDEDSAFFAAVTKACGQAWWQRPPSEVHHAARPIFIVGMPRSGTTMLEQMLSRHPAVAACGEMLALQAVLFRELPERLGREFPDCLSIAGPADWAWAAERYLAKTGDRRGGAAVFTDKLPANFLLVGPILKMFPRARVLHLVRDPLDTCLSCWFTDFAHGQNYAFDLDNLGRHYRLYRTLMRHWHGLGDDRLGDVRYEALVGDPEAVLRNVLERCGLAWDAECLAFHRSLHPTSTAAWQRVRGPVDRRRVGRWRLYERRLGRLAARLSAATADPASLARRTLVWQPDERRAALAAAEHAAAVHDARRATARLPSLLAGDAHGLIRAATLAARVAPPELHQCLWVAAARAAPGQAAIHVNAAVAHGRLGDPAAAVGALRRALALSPASAEAWSNLGNFLAGGGSELAQDAHRRAVISAPDDSKTHGNRAIALLRTTEGASAAWMSLRRALALDPADRSALTWLHQTNAALGDDADALTPLDRLRCAHPLDAAAHYERGCALHEAGRSEEAAAALRRAILLEPHTPGWRHLLDAITGRVSRAAPADYVRTLFDENAARFDEHLTERLKYRTPAVLADILARARPDAAGFARALDLGCGTGLMGSALRERFEIGHMTGVDLSPAMLARLVEKGGYDVADEADIHDFLERTDTRFHVIVAADVLVYVGALERLFAGARRALATGGLLAVSVESGGSSPFELTGHGRYVHRREYVDAAARAAGLHPLLCEPAELRLERGRPVVGLLAVFAADPA